MNGFQDSLEKQIPVKRLNLAPLKRAFSKAHTKKGLRMERRKEDNSNTPTKELFRVHTKRVQHMVVNIREPNTTPRTKVVHIVLLKEGLRIAPNMEALRIEALHIILRKGEGFENLSKNL